MPSVRWLSSVGLIVAVVGCNDNDQKLVVPHSAVDNEASAPIIGEDLRSHDFGPVISKYGRTLKHAYRLVNTTKHDIKISKLVNRKPCCGEARIGKTMLHSGEATEVEVSLSMRQEYGDIVHDTVVLTEPAQFEELVLRTMARAYAPIRIEELTPVDGTDLLSSDRPRRVDLRVVAYGSSTEPPVDLDRVDIRSTVKVEWLGHKEEADSDDDLIIQSRRFTAFLDPSGAPGERKTEIVLQDDNQSYYTHRLSWKTIPPITVSPKLIVMKPGERSYRLSVQSRDHKLFRVLRVECTVPGVQGRAVDTGAAALTQFVVVDAEPALGPEATRGVITVFTDHPGQERLDLPLVVVH